MTDDELRGETEKLKLNVSSELKENIDLNYCQKVGIKVFRSPEGNRDALADHTMGMILSLFMMIAGLIIYLKKNEKKS